MEEHTKEELLKEIVKTWFELQKADAMYEQSNMAAHEAEELGIKFHALMLKARKVIGA